MISGRRTVRGLCDCEASAFKLVVIGNRDIIIIIKNKEMGNFELSQATTRKNPLFAPRWGELEIEPKCFCVQNQKIPPNREESKI
jgi:hypothetical protein